jgi:antitoxin component YwqK of YwqJK toxin-antitoxin module
MKKTNQVDSYGNYHGLWVNERFSNLENKIIHENWNHGVLHGTAKVFGEDGKVQYECEYKNDLLDGREMRFKHYVLNDTIELCFWDKEIYEGETLEIELDNNYRKKLK